MGFGLPSILLILQILAIGFLSPPHQRQLLSRSQELNPRDASQLFSGLISTTSGPGHRCSLDSTLPASSHSSAHSSVYFCTSSAISHLLWRLSSELCPGLYSSPSTLSPRQLIQSFSFSNHSPTCWHLSHRHLHPRALWSLSALTSNPSVDTSVWTLYGHLRTVPKLHSKHCTTQTDFTSSPKLLILLYPCVPHSYSRQKCNLLLFLSLHARDDDVLHKIACSK